MPDSIPDKFQIERRLESKKITLDVADDVKDWLCDQGYDPMYGARPLQRLVQHTIMHPLARALLDCSVQDGELVRVLRQGDGVVINPLW